MSRRFHVLRAVGLGVGFLAKFVTGTIFVFNVYQDAIKETFNYTQQNVEILSSMLNVGLGIGFVPGMFYDRFGPSITSGTGLFISVPVYLLLWSTTKYPAFYHTKVWLMALYFFFAGFGSVFTYMVALNTNVINFDAKHSGKIVGFLNAFFAGSPSVFATVYYKLFTNGDETVVANQDFAGFMLLFAILYGIANILCMIFLRVYKRPDEETGEIEVKSYKSNGFVTDSVATSSDGNMIMDTSLPSPNNVKQKYPDDADDSYQPPTTLRDTLCNVDFQLFSWMFALASSVGLVCTNNLTVTSRSVGLETNNANLLLIIPITNAIISASIGIISDYYQSKIPRLSIVNFACICFVISLVIVIVFANSYSLLITATVFCGIAIGILWSICPTVMKEMFTVEHLGRNWGIALLWAALLAFGSQELFGALYDAQLPPDAAEGSFCIGKNCIVNGYVVFLCVAVLSLLMGICILLRRRCCKNKR